MSDRFTADEARRIFARAARRQHAAPAQDGLSAAELTAIGREAGLDPALVAAEAAAERVAAGPQSTWHGVPVAVNRSRLLPARLSDREWERVVDLLRAEFKMEGTAQQIGRRREWATAASSSSTPQTYRVRVEEQAGGDLVTIEAPDSARLMGYVSIGLFGGMGVLLSATSVLVESAKTSVGLTTAACMVAFGLALYAASWLSAKVAAVRVPDRFEGVLDRIDLISRLDGSSAVPPAQRLDPAHLGDAPEPAGAATSRRRTRA